LKLLRARKVPLRMRMPRYRTYFAVRLPSPRYVTCTPPSPPSDKPYAAVDPGALSVDAVRQEGVFVIESVLFYKDSKLVTDLTAEADWKRRGLYISHQVRSRFFVVQRRHSK
jgi:Mitochondrial glycoprotein